MRAQFKNLLLQFILNIYMSYNLAKVQEEIARVVFPKEHKNILQHASKKLQYDKTWKQIQDIWGASKSDRHDPSPTKLPDKTQSLLTLLSFLLFVEGLYTLCLDIIIFYLIENNHDISNRKGNYVTKFNNLWEVNLGTKLQFLSHHKFSETVKVCDTSLRNAIAHHDFTVDDDGSISCARATCSPLDTQVTTL